MKIKQIASLTVVTLSSLILIACSGSSSNDAQNSQKQQQTLVVKKSKQEISLYFNGIISPIETSAVTSPLDGTVVAVSFTYGEKIEKGDLLVQIKSSSLDKNYQTAVSGYLTAKEKYNISKNNIVGAKDLYKAGITSRQTYEAAESSLNDAYLAYLQAEHTLYTLFQKVNLDKQSIYLLKIGDEAAVKKALEASLKNILVKANTTGVALLPTDAASGGSSDSGNGKPIEVGSQVKAGQLLVSIGEMSGIKIKVNVSEVNINQIKKGEKAIIKSAAFPGISLKGEVIVVGRQASANEGGGLPSFPVEVAVKNITNTQRQLIHVGMSAKVQINIAAPDEITIPINAVKIVNNLPYVMLVDPKTGKINQQSVQTGATTISGVNIVSGLKPGDKIVFSN